MCLASIHSRASKWAFARHGTTALRWQLGREGRVEEPHAVGRGGHYSEGTVADQVVYGMQTHASLCSFSPEILCVFNTTLTGHDLVSPTAHCAALPLG